MFKVVKTKFGSCVSFRLLHTGFDLIKVQDCLILQFGHKPIKWIAYTPHKTPLIIRQYGWVLKFKIKKFKFGTTRRPVDLRPLWRSHENRARKRDNRQRTTTSGVDKPGLRTIGMRTDRCSE